jgi:SH3-like domain-containing protein
MLSRPGHAIFLSLLSLLLASAAQAHPPQNAEISPNASGVELRVALDSHSRVVTQLGPGARFQVIDTFGASSHVQLADAGSGWIPSRAVRFLMAEAANPDGQNPLRQEPDGHAGVRAQMRHGASFQVVGEQGHYYAVALPDGTKGWTYRTNVIFHSATAANTGTYNFFRDAPNRGSKVLLKMPFGTRFRPFEVVGEYYHIELADGTIGWTHRDNVLFDPEIAPGAPRP